MKIQGRSKEEFFDETWQGMPEFIQENKMEVKSLKINFASMEDYYAFGELIQQKLTPKTKSVWFPKQDLVKPSDYIYADES